MRLCNLGKGVYHKYIETVKGNENATQKLVQCKLTRNILLSHKINLDNDFQLCLYGNLHMLLDVKKDKINWIDNVIGEYSWFKLDKKRYDELNEILQIKHVNKNNKNKATNKQGIVDVLYSIIPERYSIDDVHFLCIGTDRSAGDSLGPFVGTWLEECGYKNVYGTIDEPVHAMNIQEYIDKLPKDKIIISIGAALGRLDDVSNYFISNQSFEVGAGVSRVGLPSVGDYYIKGIVNVSGFMEYEVLQNTRLSKIMKMTDDIVYGITERFPL